MNAELEGKMEPSDASSSSETHGVSSPSDELTDVQHPPSLTITFRMRQSDPCLDLDVEEELETQQECPVESKHSRISLIQSKRGCPMAANSPIQESDGIPKSQHKKVMDDIDTGNVLEKIQEIYQDMYSTARNRKHGSHKEMLASNMEKVLKSVQESSAPFEMAPLIRETPIAKRRRVEMAKFKYFGSYSFSTPLLQLPVMKKIPFHLTWLPIKRNIMVEDETVLRHIPYIQDDDPDAGKFIQELTEYYDDNMIEANFDYDEIINKILIDLVSKVKCIVQERLINDCNKDGRTLLPAKIEYESPKVDDLVFHFLSKVLPGEREPSVICKHFHALKNQPFEKALSMKDREDLCPDVDSPLVSVANSKIMDSYHSLFCRRCYQYDCRHHYGDGVPGKVMRSSDSKAIVKIQDQEEQSDSGNDLQSSWCSSGKIMSRIEVPAENNLTCTMCSNLLKHYGFSCSHCEEYLCAMCCQADPFVLVLRQSRSQASVKSMNQAELFVDQEIKSRLRNNKWTQSDSALLQEGLSIFGGSDYDAVAKYLNKPIEEVKLRVTPVENLVMKQRRTSDGIEFNGPYGVLGSRKRGRKLVTEKSAGKSLAIKILSKATSDDKSIEPYTPCHSKGNCTSGSNAVGCFGSGNFCTKYCQCDTSTCQNMFKGCRCSGQCDTVQCPCFIAGRECDPDLCHCAGNTEDGDEHLCCKNMAIQKKQHKHLLLAESDVAGWGIFAKTAIKKGEFIQEYCGEIITHDEADRRGKLYDKHKCSFLFNLNSEYVVDATRKGNKIRFANHSDHANCECRIMFADGDHRIGIYAKQDLPAGAELLFNYRYADNELEKYVPVTKLSPGQTGRRKRKSADQNN